MIPMQEPPVQVRSMCHEDLALVSDIERRSYDFPWSHGVFRDCLLAGYQCVVLEREERVAGYAILSIAAGEAHILNLCVDSAHRAHGYGEQLLDEILVRAREAEVEEIFLEVRPSNKTAIALYKKRGFYQVADRPQYYQAQEGREDAAVLSKKLTGGY
ncbi:MAG: ribosomal-protein-alanine N-acetyltransferase [Gammaproteobacteria bacterium]|nr:ribosomal protein S18-alanine N-acetyltransferase [Pseudomonadota bacterium]MCH8136210.1 ribosomal protein S18-alanine N-acetyltransferase [Pseudomonadota bacterium]TDJ42523.1 MAG: ribosomal-protein-alanine N-acetyltransferase [Gammaproteobacteria bacterium]